MGDVIGETTTDPCKGVIDVLGPVVPPAKVLQTKWSELNRLAEPATGKLFQAREAFLLAIQVKPKLQLKRGDPIIPTEPGSTLDLDPSEHYSRAFRFANKLSALFDVSSPVGEFGSGAATSVKVSFDGSDIPMGQPPSLDEVREDVRAIIDLNVTPPTPEMCAQVENPDVFMLWATNAKDPNGFPVTCLLIDILLLALGHVVYEVKAHAKTPRPKDRKVSVLPADFRYSLKLPEHSSWPAGHAFVGGSLARLLDVLIQGDNADRLVRAAERIGFNRVRGGLHTQRDVTDGIQMGWALMDHMLRRASQANGGDKPSKRLAKLWELVQMARKEWVEIATISSATPSVPA